MPAESKTVHIVRRFLNVCTVLRTQLVLLILAPPLPAATSHFFSISHSLSSNLAFFSQFQCGLFVWQVLICLTANKNRCDYRFIEFSYTLLSNNSQPEVSNIHAVWDTAAGCLDEVINVFIKTCYLTRNLDKQSNASWSGSFIFWSPRKFQWCYNAIMKLTSIKELSDDYGVNR